MIKSIHQHYAQVAYRRMSAKPDEVYGMKEDERAIYGRLCHRFPALVRYNGLRLALLFFQAKAKLPEDVQQFSDPHQKSGQKQNQVDKKAIHSNESDTENNARQQAYRYFLDDMYTALKKMDTSSNLQGSQWINEVNEASMTDYYRLSRRALDASVWFKRYAEAILGVDQQEAADEDNDGS